MRLAIMQPYIFPHLGYYQLIEAVDRFVIYDDVAYIKGGWINRNNILLGQKKHLFSIPVQNAGSNRRIHEIEIVKDPRWRMKTLETIKHAYGKAPHYSEVSELVAAVLMLSESLSKMAAYSLTAVTSFLGIARDFVVASERYENQALSGQERVIDICKRERALTYVNAMGGKKLYSPEVFERNGVQLRFLSSRCAEYKQFGDPFVAGLSIVDVLMFNPKERVRDILKGYDLVK